MSAPFYENVCHYAFLGQFTYDVKKWICFCHPCPHLFYATDVEFSMQRPSLHGFVKSKCGVCTTLPADVKHVWPLLVDISQSCMMAFHPINAICHSW